MATWYVFDTRKKTGHVFKTRFRELAWLVTAIRGRHYDFWINEDGL